MRPVVIARASLSASAPSPSGFSPPQLRSVHRPVRVVQAVLGGVGAAAGGGREPVLGGQEPRLRRRLRVARARFTGPTARVAGVATTLILAPGGFIFYNTNILNAYRTPDEAGLPRAEYERRDKRFEDLPQPVTSMRNCV